MVIDSDIKTARTELARILEGMRKGVAFTGAGISTESGIPDFRSPGGQWKQNKPIDFDTFLGSRAARDEAWRRRFAMDAHFVQARPNAGHMALARMVEEGRLMGVVTQNIDGLHQAAGVPDDKLVEIHGNTTYATCLDCSRRYELDWVRPRFEASGGTVPDCEDCAGPIKTATVSFGQSMPAQAMARAREMTLSCDVFLAIGSSLVVYPAAAFPIEAKRAGATLVIVNREPTDLDGLADLVIHAEIGEVLGYTVS